MPAVRQPRVAGEGMVGDEHGVLNSALAAELEAQLCALDRDVTSAQGREADT